MTDFEKSDMAVDLALLKEHALLRRGRLEPGRWQRAKNLLAGKGYMIEESLEQKCLRFPYKGNIVTFWPYTGWFSGKGIRDGRGIDNLIKQI